MPTRCSKPRPSLWLLIFSPFIAFIFLDPLQHGAGALEWALTVAGVVAFFALYIGGIVFFDRPRVAAALFAGIALPGFLFAPFNDGAAVFVIYSTCFIPHAVRGQIRPVIILIGAILAVVSLESWALGPKWSFAGFSIGYAIVFGIGNTWAAKQTLAGERLAKVAERERIARDLHDVLGHALSVVILKSELAGKLVERDPERARTEIGDVERTAREALEQVRQTIRGYRSENLQNEFALAKSTLETAGVAVEVQSTPPPITPEQEAVLALALREAVTNVVRHAQAATCRLRLSTAEGECRLEIHDDGRGSSGSEGFGLRGMRERIEALGGTVIREVSAGTRLTVTLPLTNGRS